MVSFIEPQWQDALSFVKFSAIISLDLNIFKAAIRLNYPRVHLYQSLYPLFDSLACSETANTINLFILLNFFPENWFIFFCCGLNPLIAENRPSAPLLSCSQFGPLELPAPSSVSILSALFAHLINLQRPFGQKGPFLKF